MRLLFHSMNDRGGLIKYEIMRSICSFFQSCDLELSPVIQFTYAAQVLFCFWFFFWDEYIARVSLNLSPP